MENKSPLIDISAFAAMRTREIINFDITRKLRRDCRRACLMSQADIVRLCAVRALSPDEMLELAAALDREAQALIAAKW